MFRWKNICFSMDNGAGAVDADEGNLGASDAYGYDEPDNDDNDDDNDDNDDNDDDN